MLPASCAAPQPPEASQPRYRASRAKRRDRALKGEAA
ncbi:hypothetical protein J2W46_004694 [Paraburkholderia strydomiana]|nr:hypothetical protein [Paraburkholderia strydomiana]